jgi:hypothetical protein
MEHKKIIQNSFRFGGANSESLNLSITLSEENSLLNDNEKNIVIDAKSVFNSERNNSKSYRIFGKLKMIFKNFYYGISQYNELKKHLYLVGDGSSGNTYGYLPYNEFAFIRNDNFKRIFQEVDVDELSTFTGFTPTFKNESTHNVITEPSYHNWNLYLSYVYQHDEEYELKYTNKNNKTFEFKSGDGILFDVEETINHMKLISPIKHGISVGEYVIISGITFYVNNLGDENYGSEDYVIIINKTQIPIGFVGFDDEVVLGKRCIDPKDINSISKYYVQKHKTLTSYNECTIDKMSIESSIWKDEKKILFENIEGENDVLVEKNRAEVVFYNFTNPFILTGLTNNNNITPTEIYITAIFRNGNGYFNYPPKIGYEFNFHDTYIDAQFSGTTSYENNITGTNFTRENQTFTSGNTLPIGTELIGSLTEYNIKDLKERQYSKVFHKITSKYDCFYHFQNTNEYFSGADDNNEVGLFYQPFYKIKLREESQYIEESTEKEIYNLPENSNYDSNLKTWRWRELYDHGYLDADNNGTDYPFINGVHFIKNDINFLLRNEKTFTKKTNKILTFNQMLKKETNNKLNC